MESNVADVTLTVSAVNDDPIADPQTLTMNEDTLRSITFTGADVDGDTLTYAVGISPAHGSLSGTAPSLTYTPAADYNGTDSFTFIVNDGQASAEALVNINIVAVNDAPVCHPVALNTADDTSATSSPDCMDVDNASLSYQVITSAQHGSAFVSVGLLNYSPAANALCGESMSADERESLDRFSKRAGLLFQVVDDILDCTASTATLGKTAGKDEATDKPTYVSLMGLPQAKAYADDLRQQARDALQPFGDRASRLNELADFICHRQF